MDKKLSPLLTDLAELEIFVQRFRSIAEEMGFALQRTGHTAFVNETADLGVALVTPDGEIFGYPHSIGITMFANLDFSSVISAFDDLAPGDVIICNDPYSSGGLSSHLPDVSVLSPIFSGDRLISFAYAYVHSTDIGGRVAGSLSPSSYEIYQEGVRIPPTRLYKAGQLNNDVLNLILCNCRVPDDNWGDLKAMVTALRVAERRVVECVEKYGEGAFVNAMSDVLNYSEKRARAVIGSIPDGVYRFSDYLDDDVVSDIPIRLCVTLTVDGERITVDFTGTDTQLRSAFNVYSEGRAHPWLIYKIMFVILTMDRGIPVNAGLMRPIDVVAPPGSLVNCEPPAAVGLRTTTGVRIQDTICGALAQAVPEVIPAAGAGYIAPIVFAEPNLNEGGLKVNVLEPMVGGTGGHEGGDGLNARDVVDIANLRNSPIEVVESVSGVRIHRYELRQDSGGPGKFRGGLGLVFEFEILAHNCLVTARGQERHRFRPWGVNGGLFGKKAAVYIKRTGSDSFIPLTKIDSLEVDAGDILRILTPGGGGYGSPLERSPELVVRDLLDGLISDEAATQSYGVVLKDGRADFEATVALRDEKKKTEERKPFSFGPEREAYEAVWTDEAWFRLIDRVFSLPVALRSTLRGRLWKAAQQIHETEGRPISEEDIDRCWSKITAGSKLGERSETANAANKAFEEEVTA